MNKNIKCVFLVVRLESFNLEDSKEKCDAAITDPNLWGRSISEVSGSHATEEDILWLKSFTKLPIVLKGVLSGMYGHP